MPSFTFPAKERLKSSKAISLLFENGNAVYSSPIKAIWIFVTEKSDSPLKVTFSVAKKNFKKAVDRNTLKRRMREAYRLNKNPLQKILPVNDTLSLQIIFIYTEKEIVSYAKVEKSIIEIINKLVNSN